MPFDIYGNHLEPGFCEVHPHVRCSYPCPCCLQDAERHDAERELRAAYEAEEYKRYCDEMLAARIDELRGMDGDGI